MLKVILSMVFIYSFSLFAFEDESCLKGDFSSRIEKPFGPFGVLKEAIDVKKSKCSIIIESVQAKYITEKWMIDVCREPVHIKYGNQFQNVVKRNSTRCSMGKTDFCEEYAGLKLVLEDKGLIYGEGQREDLTSDHGKIYCSYLLLNQYLNNGVVFSYEKPLQVVLDGPMFINDLKQDPVNNLKIVKGGKVNDPEESEPSPGQLFDF